MNTAPGFQALKLTRLDYFHDMIWRCGYDKFCRVWAWVAFAFREDLRYMPLVAFPRPINLASPAASGWQS